MGILKKFDHFRIKMICISYKIKNYNINDDGTVDVQGDVVFNMSKIKKLPIKFRHVSGSFLCAQCDLRTLEGVPNYVGGNFSLYYNKSLSSLKGSPLYVGGEYDCTNCGLETLEGIEKTDIVGSFNFTKNDIYTFDNLPKSYGKLYIDHNPLIYLGFDVNASNFMDLWDSYDPIAKIGNDYVIYLDKLNLLRRAIFKIDTRVYFNPHMSREHIKRLSEIYKLIKFDDIINNKD